MPGGTYFITTDTWQRRRVFRVSQAAEILEQTLIAYRDQGSYFIHRYVIMPDHLYALLTPSSNTSLEKAIQLIKGGSSHEINKVLPRRFPVWRPGFTEHLIRDQADYDRHVRYIDTNPVKVGMADRPEAYAFTAANGNHRLDSWPVASGAEAQGQVKGVAAGLKHRPSESSIATQVEGRDFSPAVRQENIRGFNP
jgi:putative transposase